MMLGWPAMSGRYISVSFSRFWQFSMMNWFSLKVVCSSSDWIFVSMNCDPL